MKYVKLKTVSHRFEAEMIQDMLKQIDIQVEIADQNTSENMDIYLGYEGDGVHIYIDETRLEEAQAFLDAVPEISEQTTTEKTVPFPYWIIGGFVIMLIIFILYNI